MTREIPNLVKRNGRFRYRRTVPSDVRDKINKREWVETFKPDTPMAVILARVESLRRHHEALVRRARTGEVIGKEAIENVEAQASDIIGMEPAKRHELIAWMHNDPGLATAFEPILKAIDNGGSYRPEKVPLTAAYERDVELYGGNGRDETPFKVAVNGFVDFAGDIDPREIMREQVVRWIKSLQKRVAPATVRRRVGALRAIVNRFYQDHDISRLNPFSGHKVGGAGSANDRVPFNKTMLEAISNYVAASKRIRPDVRNMMTLMKLTGAGTAEIGGLTLADVNLEMETPYVHIRANEIRGVKAASRERRIPLLPEAQEAVKDAVTRAKTQNKGIRAEKIALFPWTKSGAEGMSARINKLIRAAGVPKSPRLSAYSFRHTLKQALEDTQAPDYIARRIMGHAANDVHSKYGSPQKRLPAKLAALEAALPKLGDIDEIVYHSGESL